MKDLWNITRSIKALLFIILYSSCSHKESRFFMKAEEKTSDSISIMQKKFLDSREGISENEHVMEAEESAEKQYEKYVKLKKESFNVNSTTFSSWVSKRTEKIKDFLFKKKISIYPEIDKNINFSKYGFSLYSGPQVLYEQPPLDQKETESLKDYEMKPHSFSIIKSLCIGLFVGVSVAACGTYLKIFSERNELLNQKNIFLNQTVELLKERGELLNQKEALVRRKESLLITQRENLLMPLATVLIGSGSRVEGVNSFGLREFINDHSNDTYEGKKRIIALDTIDEINFFGDSYSSHLATLCSSIQTISVYANPISLDKFNFWGGILPPYCLLNLTNTRISQFRMYQIGLFSDVILSNSVTDFSTLNSFRCADIAIKCDNCTESVSKKIETFNSQPVKKCFK